MKLLRESLGSIPARGLDAIASGARSALVLSWVALVASPLVAAESPLAESFDLGLEAVAQARSAAETPRSQLLHGLLLADLASTERGAAEATRVLDELPPSDDFRERWQRLAVYADSVRCVVGIRQAQIARRAGLCDAAIEGLETLQDPLLKSRVLWGESFRMLRSGRIGEGAQAARRAIASAREAGGVYAEATAWNMLGLFQMEMGLFESSVESFETARQLAARTEGGSIDLIVGFNLGAAHLELGNFEEALTAAERSRRWAQQTGQPDRLLISEVHLARAHLGLGESRAALELLAPALAGDLSRHDPGSLSEALEVQARAHVALGDTEEALSLIERGSRVAQRQGNRPRLDELRLAQIEALTEAGESSRALDEARTLVADLRERPSDDLDDALLALSQLAADEGELEQATRALEERRDLLRRSQVQTHNSRLAMLEQTFELQRAERQIALVASELERDRALSQRNSSILAGLAAVFAMLIVTGSLHQSRRTQSRLAEDRRKYAEELEGLVAVRSAALELEMLQRMEGEEEKRQLEKQLAETDKLRALGQVTGGFVHDFNNLLTVVLSAAEMLASKEDLPEAEEQELLAAIRRSAKTGRDVNHGLLSYARQQTLEPEVVELQPLLDNLRRLFESALGEGIELTIDAGEAAVHVDRTQFVTALMHLLQNARDACDGRGQVTLNVEAKRSTVEVRVTDDGVGMSDELRERAIEPFYSTRSSSSGLGLSMTHGFARQSRGALRLVSELGRGTTAVLALPRAHPTDSTTDPERRAISLRGLDVVLVDDSEDVLHMVRRMLTGLGLTVRTARAGEEALAALQQRVPDLLVADVQMPGGLDGAALAHEARKQHPDLPVLLISGFAVEDNTLPVLPKPFSKEALRRALVRLLMARRAA